MQQIGFSAILFVGLLASTPASPQSAWDKITGAVGDAITSGTKALGDLTESGLDDAAQETNRLATMLSDFGFHLNTMSFKHNADLHLLDSGVVVTFSSDSQPLPNDALDSAKKKYSTSAFENGVLWAAANAKSAQAIAGFENILLKVKMGAGLSVQFCLIKTLGYGVLACDLT